ncbi:hypothetical protein JOF53_005123 [Crossiella equi]|uniref:Uncharacterized protein n=1 Tax=Crossiella equi TaxID=130796 RepID=A0ABS5AI59_9PSEU|nr:hypothetical protein [Crossiella equi]MBP2476251.1 hypothetical protein [Crossiella equi]
MNSGQGSDERFRPRQGRHRPEANALSWTPEVPKPEPPPLIDPVVDTAPPGLRKFDLGSVPASVTPPRTWKRAAWFAGLSSGVVLLVLVAAATALVSPGPGDQLESLPGYPSNILLPDDSSSPSVTSKASGTRSGAPRSGSASGTTKPGKTSGAPSGPSRLTGGDGPGRPGASTPRPPVTTVTNDRAVPLVPVDKLANQTIAFFSALPQDPQRAFDALTGPGMKGGGFPAFQQRFDNLQRVEVTKIKVDPGRGVTTAVIEVQTKDGSLSTQERELQFTVADMPLVNGERLVSSAER